MADVDLDILKKYQGDGLSLKIIGEKVGLPEMAVYRRLKRLEPSKFRWTGSPEEEAKQKPMPRLSPRALKVLEKQRKSRDERIAQQAADALIKTYVKKLDRPDKTGDNTNQRRDYGWQEIARLRGNRNPLQVLRRPSVWTKILLGLFILVGSYGISHLSINIIAKHNSSIQSDPPAAATVAPLESLAILSAVGPSAETAASAPTRPVSVPVIRVIGNSNSKLYHLPGMKYYQRIGVKNRVVFSSEDEAMHAGYRKAPR